MIGKAKTKMAQLSWNNPGNIGFGSYAARYGAVASGTTDTGHYVAQFPTPQAGVQAMGDLALSKYNAGKTTASDLIAGPNGWTPGNYTAASNVENYMGIPHGSDLNLNNPSNMASFQSALARQEGYGSQTSQQYFFGNNQYQYGGSQAAQDAAQDKAQDAGDYTNSDPYTGSNGAGPTGATNFNGASIGDGSGHFGLGGAQTPDGGTVGQSGGGPVDGYSTVTEANPDMQDFGKTMPDGTTSLGTITTDAPQQNFGSIGSNPWTTYGSPDIKTDPFGTGAPAVSQPDPTAVNPAQTDTTAATPPSSSTGMYAGDMDVPPALDTVARSIGDAAAKQSTATINAANATKSGLDNLGKQVATASQTQAAATSQLSSQVASSTDYAGSLLTKLTTSMFGFETNIFVRVAVVVLGLIFVAAALMYFKPVQQTVVKAGKAGLKMAAA